MPEQITQAGDERNRLLRKIEAVRRMRTNVAEIETILADCRPGYLDVCRTAMLAALGTGTEFAESVPVPKALLKEPWIAENIARVRAERNRKPALAIIARKETTHA